MARWRTTALLGIALALGGCSGLIGGDEDDARAGGDGGGDGDGDLGAGGADGEGEATQGLGVRQLRLLTRREYDRTIDALFPFGGEPPTDEVACEALGDCDARAESCVGDVCVADPCELFTFLLPALDGPLGSVVVAGDFNGWGATEAAGGWPMPYDASVGAHVVKRALGEGRHLYKLVVNGTEWITDPAAPSTEPDGFGGTNGVVSLSCDAGAPPSSGEPPPRAWSEGFPAESRPHDFPFDGHAESGLVTRVHAEQYLRAAATIAARVADDPGLVGCEPSGADDPCLEALVEDLGRRAYRRPLEEEERLRLVSLVRGAPDARTGVVRAVRVILSSPWFLYRSEIGEDLGDGTARLTAFERATALSYGLWGETPDDALLDAAASGTLESEDDLEREARRLLADPRAGARLGLFGVQWLGVEHLDQATKAAGAEAWGPELAAEMREETRRLVARVATGEESFRALFTGDTTDAEGALAALYGADEGGVLPEARRAGVLAHGSVLAAYAHSDQTSPVRRGLFVRQRLLCQELGTPPANAGAVPEVDPSVSTRERFSQHSSDPACEGCHRYIDPVGFGFEAFDALGAARTEDAGHPIDDAGVLFDLEAIGAGTEAPFRGLPELGSLLAESEASRACFVRQVHRFLTGRLETEDDEGTLTHLDEAFGEEGDVPRLLVAFVRSRSFSLRRVP